MLARRGICIRWSVGGSHADIGTQAAWLSQLGGQCKLAQSSVSYEPQRPWSMFGTALESNDDVVSRALNERMRTDVPQPTQMTLDELVEEFEFLADWDDQCDFLIDLGFELPKLPEAAKTEENFVHGCQSNVWLVAEVKPSPTHDVGTVTENEAGSSDAVAIEFIANSDAVIVNGLIAVLMILFNGRTPREILATDVQAVFTKLGLERHLSPQRRNGLYGMVERIRQIAAQAV